MRIALIILGGYFAFALLLTSFLIVVEVITKGKCPPLLQWTISFFFAAGIAGFLLMRLW